MDLNGARVLITGATGGIGVAIAAAVAARGASVVLSGRRAEELDKVATRLGARAVVADLAVPGGAEKLVEDAGDLDVVIANAALPGSGDLLDFSLPEIDRALEVNLRAPIVLARLAGARMAERGKGHLVFINSLSGKAASGKAAMYNATKFGLRGFALALRADMQERGVGVSSIYPGFVRDAGMFARSGATLPRGVGTRSPEDVANAVVRAIERNIAETDVAPLPVRLGASFALIAPDLANRVQGLLGADKVITELAAGQRDMR
ncbi:SDR family NAD(P)-dependent oxidoreductase [Nocardia sp. NPDC005998]|uniref:SDR family NAD(P)-dependent oxidoreductase n=1 Tax=Nocardia sp. NPDC005998 TaxID=3156894 RepID=UPI0033B93BFE